jgi:hypothetical protein
MTLFSYRKYNNFALIQEIFDGFGVSVTVIRPHLPPRHRLQLTHWRRKKPMLWSVIARQWDAI